MTEAVAESTAADSAVADSTAESRAGRTLADAALVSVVASAVSLVVSVARSKVTAHYLGPEGVGRSGEVQGLFQLAAVPLSMLTGPALLAALSRSRAERAYDSAATLLMMLAVPLCVLGSASAAWLLPVAAGDAWALSVPAAVAAFASAVMALPNQLLIARGQVTRQAAFGVAVALSSALAVSLATATHGLRGQFVASALMGTLALAASFVVASRLLPTVRVLPRPALDRMVVRDLLSVGATSLVGGLALNGALNVIRWTLEGEGGAAAAGQFQASWSLGATYFGIVLGSLGNFVFPRYAAAKDAAALSEEVEAASRFVLRMAPPLILLAMAIRRPLLVALYSGRFDLAAEMAGYQMAGDLAKGLAWAYAGALLFRGRVRAYLVSELFCAGLLAIGSVAAVRLWGPVGTGVASLVAYAAYLVMTAWLVQYDCGVRVPWRRVAQVLGGTLLFGAFVAASGRWRLLEPVGVVVSVVWAWRSGLAGSLMDRLRAKVPGLSRHEKEGGAGL